MSSTFTSSTVSTLDVVDTPHRLVLSGILELPFGRGKMLGKQWNRGLEAVLGG